MFYLRFGRAGLGWAWGWAQVGVGRRFGFLSMVYIVHDLPMSSCLPSCVSQMCIMCISNCCACYLIYDLIDLRALFGVYAGTIVLLIALSCSSLIYSLLDLFIHHAGRINATPILGGLFNAAIGAPQVGACGNGARHRRGAPMIPWILERGLQVLNRLDSTMAIEESWTCKRAVGGALVDFLLANLRVRVMRAWADQSFPIGLDHRCVHCLFCIGGPRPAQIKRCA